LRLLLLGPPGAGKGTQGVRLASALGVRHIAAGDVLRAEVERNTETGRRVARFLSSGELAPDDLIINALMPALVAAAGCGGYILDGFPRTERQASELDALSAQLGIPIEGAVYLDVQADELERRLLARAKIEGRDDDTSAVIARRLAVFAASTRPMIDRYARRGILITVDGTQPADGLTVEIKNRLAARKDKRVGGT
jgi:adenylate kinase